MNSMPQISSKKGKGARKVAFRFVIFLKLIKKTSYLNKKLAFCSLVMLKKNIFASRFSLKLITLLV